MIVGKTPEKRCTGKLQLLWHLSHSHRNEWLSAPSVTNQGVTAQRTDKAISHKRERQVYSTVRPQAQTTPSYIYITPLFKLHIENLQLHLLFLYAFRHTTCQAKISTLWSWSWKINFQHSYSLHFMSEWLPVLLTTDNCNNVSDWSCWNVVLRGGEMSQLQTRVIQLWTVNIHKNWE